jgi:hypothetical protein
MNVVCESSSWMRSSERVATASLKLVVVFSRCSAWRTLAAKSTPCSAGS